MKEYNVVLAKAVSRARDGKIFIKLGTSPETDIVIAIAAVAESAKSAGLEGLERLIAEPAEAKLGCNTA